MPPEAAIPKIDHDRRTWGWVLLLACVTTIAYLPAIRGGFIWDDDGYVTKPVLRGLHGLWLIWSDPHTTEQFYPLLHTAFWVEYRLWGETPLGYHIVNVLLHITSACLLAAVLRRLWTDPGAANHERRPQAGVEWLAAFLFALHPVCVESVAWIAEQKNTLSTMFYLATAIAYLRWREETTRRWYFLATALFICAILSKSVAATLPAAILVILWWKQGRLSWKRDVFPLAPWFVLTAASGLFTGWVERKLMGAEGPDFDLSIVERSLQAGRAIWFYLGRLLWPANLIFIYPRWHLNAGIWWQYLFPLAAVAAAAILYACRRRTRGLLAAYLLFIGTLFPTLGFLNVYAFFFSYVADHWLYLASLGVFSIAAAAWGKLQSKVFRWLPVGVLMALGVLTWRQCRMYSDARTVFLTTVKRNPGCAMAYLYLGATPPSVGRPEAIPYLRKAIEAKPNYAEAHYDLGLALVAVGRRPEAIPEYEEALRLKPTYYLAWLNLADAFAAGNRFPEAIARYEKALSLQPYHAEVHNNLAIALVHMGRLPEAIDHYRVALRLDPDQPEVLNNLGNALVGMHQIPEAITQYREALRLQPDYFAARSTLGNVLADSGQIEEAAEQFTDAVRLQPYNSGIRNNLGSALAQLGRFREAREQFERALQLKPGDPEVLANLVRVQSLEQSR